MSINLENELEPLLARLNPYFDDLVARCYQGDEDKLRVAANEAWQALLHLGNRFRSYYTLDNFDLDGLSAQLFDPTWDVPPPAKSGVPQANWYGAVGGASLYSKIVSADYYVSHDLEDLISPDWAGKDPTSSTGWSGKAANAFRTNFVERFQPAAYVQAAGAGNLALMAAAIATDVSLTKRSIVWICKSLVSYLGVPVDAGPAPVEGEEDKASPAGEKEDNIARGADIASGILNAADTIWSLADWPGRILQFLKFVADAVKVSREPHPTPPWQPTFDVYGVEQDPFAVLMCAENALADVDRHIAGFDETFGRLLQQALDPGGPFASTPGPGGTVRLDLGGLDLTPAKASDFAKAGNPDHDYPTTDPMVADVVKLYRAGAVTMPKAADLYDAGVNMCTQLHITGVDYQYPSTVTKFNEAAHRLGDTMAQVREDLRCSGDALVMAASTYQTQDAFDAQQIQMLESQIRADELGNPYHY